MKKLVLMWAISRGKVGEDEGKLFSLQIRFGENILFSMCVCVFDGVLCVAEKYLHSNAFKQLVNWLIRND